MGNFGEMNDNVGITFTLRGLFLALRNEFFCSEKVGFIKIYVLKIGTFYLYFLNLLFKNMFFNDYFRRI